MAMIYTDWIAELRGIRSTGTVGHSYAVAMAAAVKALLMTELIGARAPRCSIEQDELATLEWV